MVISVANCWFHHQHPFLLFWQQFLYLSLQECTLLHSLWIIRAPTATPSMEWAWNPGQTNLSLSAYNLIPEQRQKTKAVVAETIAAPWKDSIGFCCLDSQSCLFTILSRPDSSTAPSIYWTAPFVSNRCMLCQGFCSLVCLLASEKSSLTPRFVLVRENSKASLQTVEDSPIGKKASALFYIVSSCTYPQQRYSKADFNFCTFRDWVHFVRH